MTEAVYSVGRFQPPTIGHAAMIQALIATGKPAFVFVSSSQSPRDKNPLTSAEKIAFLRKMFPSGVTFVDTATCSPSCGGPIGGREYLVAQGYTTLTLVGGSDREPTFGPEAPLWDYLKEPDYTGPRTPPAFQALRRDATDTSGSLATGTMSGTKARSFVLNGDRASFRAAVTLGSVMQTDADALFDLLATRLASRKTKREEIAESSPSKRMRRGGGDDDIAMIAEDDEPTGGRRRKTRRRARPRTTRRLQRGGVSIDIRQKPIAVVFSHGGCELKTACKPSGVYRLDTNVQSMVLAHPGESLTTSEAVKTLLESNVFRYRTFEPLFDMHSMSDFTKTNAIYFNLASKHERSPFTSEGKSLFETPLRATEGSLVPNSLFTFEREGIPASSSIPAFGVYLYSPERSQGVRYISLGAAKALRLSDILSFLKTNRYYDPAVGIGIIQLSCNTFYKDYVGETKVFLNEEDIPALSDPCHAIEGVYHAANAEYLATERLGADALQKKYGTTVFPIVSNRRARSEPPEVLAMMKAVRGGRRKTRRLTRSTA